MDPTSGGPCQGIRNIIPELEKLGVQNEVVSLDSPNTAFLGQDEFPVYALGPATNPWAYNPALINWLSENLSRFDVVVVHGLWLYPGYAARNAFLQLKKRAEKKGTDNVPKFFVMPHGMLDPYFQKAPERKFKAIRNWIYWKLIEGKVINEADGILYTCEEELRLGGQTFRPYRPKREINVGFGVAAPAPYTKNMEEAFNRICPELNNQPYFLFLSRIHHKKGLHLLMKAYLQLMTENPSACNIPKLVIAGPGLDSAYGRKIQELVNENPMLKRAVFFTGMLSGDAKWGAYYGCEAFILPSHQENFGIAVVEALACGKPVLISNKINIWREIEAAGGGIVGEDDLQGTYQTITTWLDASVDEKRAFGKNARKCFDQRFAIGINAKRYLNALIPHVETQL